MARQIRDRQMIFLSTPSVGRATALGGVGRGVCRISIHALRGEGDGLLFCTGILHGNFYPRPPWGGRLYRLPSSPMYT